MKENRRECESTRMLFLYPALKKHLPKGEVGMCRDVQVQQKWTINLHTVEEAKQQR